MGVAEERGDAGNPPRVVPDPNVARLKIQVNGDIPLRDYVKLMSVFADPFEAVAESMGYADAINFIVETPSIDYPVATHAEPKATPQ